MKYDIKHFSQGAKDFDDGINFRLEHSSHHEYESYMKGREYAKREWEKANGRKFENPSKKVLEPALKPVEPIKANLDLEAVEPISVDWDGMIIADVWGMQNE